MVKIKKIYANKFTILDNKVLQDSSLSFKARGLFAYLWSQQDNWDFYEKEVATHSKDGISAVRSGLDELENHGYLIRTRKRVKGKLKGTRWFLSDSQKLEKPILENLNLENLILENRTLISNNSNKEQPKESNKRNKKEKIQKKSEPKIPYQEIIEYLNKVSGSKFKYTTKSYQKDIKARFKDGATLDDFKKVIDNKARSWRGTKFWKYMRPSTLFRSKFDEYLNEKPTSNNRNPTSGGYKGANNFSDLNGDDSLPF